MPTLMVNGKADFGYPIESAQKKYKMAEEDVVELAHDIVCAFAMPLRENGYQIAFTAPACVKGNPASDTGDPGLPSRLRLPGRSMTTRRGLCPRSGR